MHAKGGEGRTPHLSVGLEKKSSTTKGLKTELVRGRDRGTNVHLNRVSIPRYYLTIHENFFYSTVTESWGRSRNVETT